jgi:prophage regulatory protein
MSKTSEPAKPANFYDLLKKAIDDAIAANGTSPVGFEAAPRLITQREVMSRTSLSRAGIHHLQNTPDSGFPQPVRISEGRVAYVEHEVDSWVLARVSERDKRLANGGADD